LVRRWKLSDVEEAVCEGKGAYLVLRGQLKLVNCRCKEGMSTPASEDSSLETIIDSASLIG